MGRKRGGTQGAEETEEVEKRWILRIACYSRGMANPERSTVERTAVKAVIMNKQGRVLILREEHDAARFINPDERHQFDIMPPDDLAIDAAAKFSVDEVFAAPQLTEDTPLGVGSHAG
jgi:hypothetical protein